MAFSEAGRAALRSIGAAKSHYDPNQPRDRTGKWTDGDGPAGMTAMAAKVSVDQTAKDIFNRMRLEKKSEAAIIAEMERQGIPNAKGQFGALLRAARKQSGPVRVKKVLEAGGHRPPPPVPTDTRSPLEVARDAWAKNENTTLGKEAVRREVEAALKARESTQLSLMKMEGGMTTPEAMYEADWENIKIRYAAGSLDSRTYAAEILTGAARNKLPLELTAHTRSINISTQRNRHDDIMAAHLGIPGFRSAASVGPSRDITVYNVGIRADQLQYAESLIAHEMSHAMATGTYGDSTPPTSNAIRKLYDSWKASPNTTPAPPSNYARTNSAEALAEVVSARFITNTNRFPNGLSKEWRAAADATLADSRKALLRKTGQLP